MPEMIKDMTGRLIGIHDKPGWKISAYDRDVLYQEYRDRQLHTKPRPLLLRWVRENAEQYGISGKRLLDILYEGDGNRGKAMQWWVNCSNNAKDVSKHS